MGLFFLIILYVVKMVRLIKVLILTLLGLQNLIIFDRACATEIIISDVRIGAKAEKTDTRVVLELNKKLPYKTFFLEKPNRFVIDLPEVGWQLPARPLPKKAGIFLRLRYGLNKPGNSRIVLDLSQPAVLKRAYFLPSEKNAGVRLVIDIIEKSMHRSNSVKKKNITTGVTEVVLKSPRGLKSKLPKNKFKKDTSPSNPNHKQDVSEKIVTSKFKLTPRKPLKYLNLSKKIIVVDAGHGGLDPGAIGQSGIYEKHITLAMAKELSIELEKTGKYEAILTRGHDKYVGLRDRVKISRRKFADIFISLHADSIRNKKISGPSVYTLSERASDKEAAQLAEQENKANIIMGFDLSEFDSNVKNIFIDLTRRESMNQSAKLATSLVDGLKSKVKVLRNPHRFAGFAVLKAVDVPSVLIEMGFLSNAKDEKLLKSKKYRKKLALAIIAGIDQYFLNIEEAANY